MLKTEMEVREGKKIALARILVATDFSPASDRALEYGISLARRYGSKIFVTHVITHGGYRKGASRVPSDSEKKHRREAQEGIGKIEKSGRLLGLRQEMVIAEGPLWPTIEDLVNRYEIDLVIVGTHGMNAIEQLVIGSNAEEIFRQSHVPVLTVGPAAQGEPLYEAEFKHILFATDFGPGAERQAEYAFSLAQEHRARLTLLNVPPYGDDFSDEAVARKREQVTKQLRALLPNVAELHCLPDYVVVIGEPVDEILRWANIVQADLIVMGAKTRKGLVVGHVPHTIAHGVVCQAKCPVLTVRP
jgi:nucleotide-binding universal stress UspA family protein